MRNITKGQVRRGNLEFNRLAGKKENVRTEFFSNAYWVYGSELATLRIFQSYLPHTTLTRISVGYSENRQTHWFMLEMGNVGGEIRLSELEDTENKFVYANDTDVVILKKGDGKV